MTQIVVAQRMWQRRDTAGNWSSANPVLAAGEIGVELGATPADTKFKIGTGSHAWNDLPYFAGGGDAGPAPVIEMSGSAYSIADLTPGAWHLFTAPGVVTVTVPTGVPSEDQEFGVAARGGGEVQIAPQAGVTVLPPLGGSLTVDGGGFSVLKNVGSNSYELVGATDFQVAASSVSFDGGASGLGSGNVQDAIEEVLGLASSGVAPVVFLSGTAYSLADLTSGSWHVFTSSSAIVISVMNDVAEPVPAAAEFGLECRGSGSLVLTEGSTVNIVPPKGGSLELEQRDFAVLKRISVDEYTLVGSTVDE